MDHDRDSYASYAPDYGLDSARTLVTASELVYAPSEATTLYEGYLFDDTSSSTVHVVKPETENARLSFYKRRSTEVKVEGNWQWGDDRYPNKESLPSTTTSRSLRKILSSFIGLFTDYRTRKQLSAIRLRVDGCRRYYHPLSIQELQAAYEYLHKLEHHRNKFAMAALTLRLSVLKLLFDIWGNPVVFSEKNKDFFQKLWLDLDYESSRAALKDGTHKQISNLRNQFFLCVLNGLPVNRSISEIIPDGLLAVKALCKELAYGSGVYSIQKILIQIARTDWGHGELLRLSLQPCLKAAKGESDLTTNLIIDCIMRLLSFGNGFSHTMAFRIFGGVAEYNQKVHALLAGPMGVTWLVGRFHEQTYSEEPAYRSFRQGETYCHALMTACRKGFMNCVLECNIICTLLCWVTIFNIRDEAMCSAIEDNLQDDSDVELGQIACCELVILLMKTTLGKKQFLSDSSVLRTFMDHPNRSFSDWKLCARLATIAKLLES